MPNESLREYERKRDFKKTPEPAPKAATRRKAATGGSFVIQKHAARRLHFDFRLEIDGVLKSWAVTRGPSLNPADKRLAVETEDHPMDYASFEGVIPRGEYGGGSVMVWDRGEWIYEGSGSPLEAWKKGRLKFRLEGERLHGRWNLARMGSGREKRNNWLLIKGDDEFARTGEDAEIAEIETTSCATGRSMEEIAGEEGATSFAARRDAEKTRERKKSAGKVGKAAVPRDVTPQLCQRAEGPPKGPDWLHEIKFDGYRVLASVEDGKPRLLTRNGHDWTEKFGPVTEAMKSLPVVNALLDGEVVVLDEGGLSSFALLQDALSDVGRAHRKDLVYYAFDLLFLDGEDLRSLPLEERKRRLLDLLPPDPEGALRYSDHIDGASTDGSQVLQNACSMALEGVISKRRNGAYKSGRGRDWIKTKCVERQEFVIGGFQLPTDKSNGVGALFLGVQGDDGLRYAGKVGTGWTARLSRELRDLLETRKREDTPFVDLSRKDAGKPVVFVEPDLVCEVEFLTWSKDGLIRQGSFQGLREDKHPSEITREDTGRKVIKGTPRPVVSEQTEEILGVRLSNPDKVMYQEMGLTKRGLAEFVAGVSDRLLRELARRPVSLVRCPDGPGGQCFFQRHGFKGLPEGVAVRDIGGSKGETLEVLDEKGLIGLVQLGVLEFHPWGCRIDKPEHPDRLIFDLDPDPEVPFTDVKQAAVEVRDRLDDGGLVSFVKTTGGKGLHVVVPLSRRQDWSEVKAFGRALAETMTADDPQRYVATMSKAKRKGRIFIDFFRNDRGNTAIAAWSPRARPGAPVAVPLEWDDLGPLTRPDRYTVESLGRRLAHVGDPWEGMDEVNQSLTKKARRTVGLD